MRTPTAALRAYFRQLGQRGGTQAAKNMTAAQRTARATKASRAAALARKTRAKR